jgi:hypothetical protein
MLEVLEKRARSAGVFDMIQPHLSKEDDIGLTEPIDFALTFWMVHEIPEKTRFLQQIHAVLKDSEFYLLRNQSFTFQSLNLKRRKTSPEKLDLESKRSQKLLLAIPSYLKKNKMAKK